MSELEQQEIAGVRAATGNGNPPMKPATLGWGVAAIILSILLVVFNKAPMVLAAGFFAKCVAIVAGAVLGWVCALIGDAMRRFAKPNAIFTSGGIFQLIWVRLFWVLGPQVVGLVMGSAAGIGLVLR